jgi:uncharacterized protein with NRDE domain
MCLIVVGVGASERHRLLVAANRDEQHARPALPAAWWPDAQQVLGGRDLAAGGSWLAIDGRGRFAAVTNVRDPQRAPRSRSRGSLVAGFLAGGESAAQFAARVVQDGDAFGAFNLLLFDGRELYFASNRAPAAQLATGSLHAFSNAPSGTQWPKTASALQGATAVLANAAPVEPLFDLLAQRAGRGEPDLRIERTHFVVGPVYGTRCSTVVLVAADGSVTFAERTFDAAGTLTGEVRELFALRR